MKLSNKYQYVILCEDSQMDTFIRSFLKYFDICSRKIRTVPIPAGCGCGEAHVRKSFPKEVQILVSSKYKKSVLVVCIDADSYLYEVRMKELSEAIKELSIKIEEEMILVWIPKREIETWISFFRGDATDEEMIFIHNGKPKACRNEAKEMYQYCIGIHDTHLSALPSIIRAKDEFEKVCKLQSKRDGL